MTKRNNTQHSLSGFSEDFSRVVIEEADIVKPILKEQLFKEYITGSLDTEEILNIYCRSFGVNSDLKTRMLIIYPIGETNREEMYFFRNMTEKTLRDKHVIAAAVICRKVIIVTDVTDEAKVTAAADKVSGLIKACYQKDVMIVYSGVLQLAEAPLVYRELTRGMGYAFYASDIRIARAEDIKINTGSLTLSPQYGSIEKAVKAGNRRKAEALIDLFFDELRAASPMPSVAKTYCLELYVCIIRCCEAEKIEKYMRGITEIQNAATLTKIRELISQKAAEIIEYNMPKEAHLYSALITQTLELIDNNISNEKLSLRWLASTALYTNVDYLGKLFKREVGDNFSHYVMERRMELAKSIIAKGNNDRIYEIARRVGYGSNPQYFSQVFKRHTGVSPLEYKEFARAN